MITLAKLVTLIGAKYLGDDLPFTGASIDSRTLKPNELFIAIKGPQFDGHQFAQDAVKAGACAVVCERPLGLKIPEIIVPNTTRALADLAQAWRAQFNIPIIAVTGSAGKTTTRNMIGKILKQRGPTLVPERNFNNHFGVPLTLLQLRPIHQFAVIEVGASEVGEIAHLANLVKPTIAVVTLINSSHIEGFGSLDNTANEKSNLYSALPSNGVAIINADEPYSKQWNTKTAHCQQTSFGIANAADVRATDIHFEPNGAHFNIATPIGLQPIYVGLLGEHIVIDAVAAAAAALAAGANLSEVALGLAAVKAAPGRMSPTTLDNGTIVIDDTYNASAGSVKSALQQLGKYSHKRTIAVLANMGELGAMANEAHAEVGRWLTQFNIDQAYVTGDESVMSHLVQHSQGKARYFKRKSALLELLTSELNNNTVVLVKGSRSTHMETVVQTLLETFKHEHAT